MSPQPAKPTLLARLRARLPKLPSRRPVPQAKPARAAAAPPAALDLTEEEIAAILLDRFTKQVEADGAPLALWRAVNAAKDETRHQVRRGLIALAALQILLAVGLAVLPHLL
jgi:hypothetical protein